MIKKITLFLIIFFSFLGLNNAIDRDAINCSFPDQGVLVDTVKTCINEEEFGGVVPPGDNLDLAQGNSFSESLKIWAERLATLIGSLAVVMLVYGSFLLVISGGEEEKIKKAKDIIKWSLIGFIGLISAGLIVMLIVKLGYFFGQI